MMHAYAYANANAMQLKTKHLKCYRPQGLNLSKESRNIQLGSAIGSPSS
jgi:hypothetical protein